MAPLPSSETQEAVDQVLQQPQGQVLPPIQQQQQQPALMQDITQDQHQQLLQQQATAKPGLQSTGSSNSVNQSQPSSPSGFLASVRTVAAKTTDMLGLGSSDSSNNDSYSHPTNSSDHVQGGGGGSVPGEVHEGVHATMGGTASVVAPPLAAESVQDASNTSSFPSTAAAPSLPSTFTSTPVSSLPPASTNAALPHPPLASAPVNPIYNNAAPPISHSNITTAQSNPAAAQDSTPTVATKDRQQRAMDPSQADLMTMEASQMNGGPTAYNHHYDGQDYTDSSYTAGPGSFPDSYANSANGYEQNGAMGTQINDGDDTNITFVYANEKRFSDFHALFRSVPDDEKLIEDYGCALQKEILVQGRLYISENHVCFNANIFGWVTNLVIAFSEITAIEKRLTAFVIPNAISIVTTTNTKGHFFASFLSRDAAHDLLMAAWRKSFPCAANASALSNNAYLRQNRSNVTLNDNDDDDAASFISARPASDSRRNRHRRSSSASQNWTADEADWDEAESVDGKSTGSRRRGSKRAAVKKILKEVIAPIIPDDDSRGEGRSGRARSVSELPPRPSSFDYGRRESLGNKPAAGMSRHSPVQSRSREESELPSQSRGDTAANGDANASLGAAGGGAAAAADVIRTATTCQCSKDGRHYANTFMSEKYPGSIESMWKLLFESDFNKSFLTNDVMKGADVQEEPWRKESDGNMSKVTKYTKWLGLSIGPKTTKATLTDVCEHRDFDEYVTTVTTTSTPDVPSGGSFTTKCRTCITWAGPNQVQVVVTGAVEFTKSSWIKGQIEKGAAEGMTTHYKELNLSIRQHITAHPDEFAQVDSGKGAAVAANVGAGAATAETNGSVEKDRGARSRANGRQYKTKGSLETEKANESAPVDKTPLATTTTTASVSKDVGANGDKAQGMLSRVLAAFGDEDSASHLALVGVLVLVMLANIYIWFQISRVTSQIEKIQNEVFYSGPVDTMHKNSGNNNDNNHPLQGMTDEAGGWSDADERYTREQEEAMWAWLTEREARQRQYQRTSAKDWLRTRKGDDDTAAASKHDVTAEDEAGFHDFSVTEVKLQAKINELQQQLETLERALDIGVREV
ncbi:hypothetical protein EDD11_006042 [Mortierella claussenii]|nr:hypothetical protein EDD11_006042 [Mortierella claussenii]